MMFHRIPFIALLLTVVAYASVSAQTPVNGYARVSSVAGAVLSVANVDETYDTFEDGEYVIIMQMQDNVLGNTTNSASFGNMTATPLSAGLYEVAMIASHTEVGMLPNTITLTTALTNSYNTGANSRVQVISYPVLGSPNYTSPAAGITATAWNGNIGGVVAFWVNGTLTLGGNITANGVGFRGGAKNTPNGYSACEGTTYATAIATRYAGKGESIYLNTTAAYGGGRGKILNGGGGGGQGAVIFSGAQPTTNVTTQTNAGAGGSSCSTCTAAQNGAAGAGPNNSGILTGNPNPLPIELISFTAVQNGNVVDILWETATETNNDYFTIERMDDSGNTIVVGEVDGAGTITSIRFYSLADESPVAGMNYYRLRQTDFDGTVSWSEWISVNFTNVTATVSVSPNPTEGTFNLSLSGFNGTVVQVFVTDALGREVSSTVIPVESDVQSQQLSLEGQPAGMYLVTVVYGDLREQIRIVRY